MRVCVLFWVRVPLWKHIGLPGLWTNSLAKASLRPMIFLLSLPSQELRGTTAGLSFDLTNWKRRMTSTFIPLKAISSLLLSLSPPPPFCPLETGSYFVAQAGLEISTLLFLECWNYRHASSCQTRGTRVLPLSDTPKAAYSGVFLSCLHKSPREEF